MKSLDRTISKIQQDGAKESQSKSQNQARTFNGFIVVEVIRVSVIAEYEISYE